MKLVNTRAIFTHNSTIGRLFVDDTFLCYILEPTDRGLDSTMDIEVIKQKKVFGHTAIPTGIYNLQLVSGKLIYDRFHFLKERYTPDTFMVPELQDVKDYSGVLIHPGNYPKDTEGCSLVGKTIAAVDFIGDTPDAFYELQDKCFAAIKAGGVTYEIKREPNAWSAFIKSQQS